MICAVCGHEFYRAGNSQTCSSICSRELRRRRDRGSKHTYNGDNYPVLRCLNKTRHLVDRKESDVSVCGMRSDEWYLPRWSEDTPSCRQCQSWAAQHNWRIDAPVVQDGILFDENDPLIEVCDEWWVADDGQVYGSSQLAYNFGQTILLDDLVGLFCVHLNGNLLDFRRENLVAKTRTVAFVLSRDEMLKRVKWHRR